MMALKKLKTEGTLSDKAYLSLKQNILELELKPGEMLLEDRLSDMLGISRTPIREALKKLTYEGLVSFRSGKGTYVTELTIENFLKIYPIRNSLEILSIKFSCQERALEDIKKFRVLIDEQIEIVNKPSLDDKYYLEIDRKLHMAIAESTKNDILVKYLLQINESYNRYLFFTKFERRATRVTDEHTKLVDAIEERNSAEAEKLMINHLNGVKESIYSALIKANKF